MVRSDIQEAEMALEKEARVDSQPSTDSSTSKFSALKERFFKIRHFTEELCKPLKTEDYVIQSMYDVSPTRWHLAHSTWFFEGFILSQEDPTYKPLNPMYHHLFNSFYNALGESYPREKRGLLSRPTVAEVYEFREYINEKLWKFLGELDEKRFDKIARVVEMGLQHEQQHQELILTDIKHVFSMNPLHPAYSETESGADISGDIPPIGWIDFTEGVYWIGHEGKGFAFDNEYPRHRVFIEPFQLASRLVTNGEFMAFIEDGGYQKPLLWLSEGWNEVNNEKWNSPAYWEKKDGEWWHHTLCGFKKINESEPVCHVSYYEADVFANWAGARLPYETEWEAASKDVPAGGNFVDDKKYHPVTINENDGSKPAQLFGDVWEWTRSHYSPYPGYKAAPGAIGEYNGKFMCNQFVLRGGSCATSSDHIRPTYRNFFYAAERWQFMGIRLAKDVKD